MKWTERHSKNAVAAKSRRRRERTDEPFRAGKAPKLGRFVPDFTINIRARSGERVQITATRFGKQFLTGEGTQSARQISRGIEMLLRYCTP